MAEGQGNVQHQNQRQVGALVVFGGFLLDVGIQSPSEPVPEVPSAAVTPSAGAFPLNLQPRALMARWQEVAWRWHSPVLGTG